MGNIISKVRKAERKKTKETKRVKKGKAPRQSVSRKKTPGGSGESSKKAAPKPSRRADGTLRSSS